MENHRGNLILMVIGFAFALWAAVGIILSVPTFNDSFTFLDMDTSWWLTRVVLGFYPVALVVPLGVLVAWFAWPNKRWRGVACLIGGVGGACLSIALTVAALSQPIFDMGATF